MRHLPEYYIAEGSAALLSGPLATADMILACVTVRTLAFALGLVFITVVAAQQVPPGFAQRTEEQILNLQRESDRQEAQIERTARRAEANQNHLARIEGAIETVKNLGYLVVFANIVNALFSGLLYRRTCNGSGPVRPEPTTPIP